MAAYHVLSRSASANEHGRLCDSEVVAVRSIESIIIIC
jgi:hypothetical protein